MINGKKVTVILPAYNAANTLVKTYNEIPQKNVDDIILVDDASQDDTVKIAKSLDMHVVVHEKNLGYGANQKTCYAEALMRGADIVVMLHPDYQYPPKLVVPIAELIAEGKYDAIFASRFLDNSARKGGMPRATYFANRISTKLQSILLGCPLSEFHSGYRAFSRKVLSTIPLLENSNGFLFESQILTQILYFGFSIGEIPTECYYHEHSSSIGIKRTVLFSFGTVVNIVQYLFAVNRIYKFSIFNSNGQKIK